jgi:hypothetical protein
MKIHIARKSSSFFSSSSSSSSSFVQKKNIQMSIVNLMQNWQPADLATMKVFMSSDCNSSRWIPSSDQPNMIATNDDIHHYAISKFMGQGPNGVVHAAVDDDGVDVALKFMRIQTSDLNRANELFTRYVLQRSYYWCISNIVCMQDAFIFKVVTADQAPGWYGVIVLEKMDGNILDLLNSEQFSAMSIEERYEDVMMVVCKMVKVMCDLEAHGMPHDDVRLSNFLYRLIGPREYEIKVTDCDLSSFQFDSMLHDELSSPRFRNDASSFWFDHPGVRYARRMERAEMKYEPPECAMLRLLEEGMSFNGRDVSSELDVAVRDGLLDPNAIPPAIVFRFHRQNSGDFVHHQQVKRLGSRDIFDFRSGYMFNLDWLGRMIAFEMMGAVREIFLVALGGNELSYDDTVCVRKLKHSHQEGATMMNALVRDVIAPLGFDVRNNKGEMGIRKILHYPMTKVRSSSNAYEYLCVPFIGSRSTFRPTMSEVLARFKVITVGIERIDRFRGYLFEEIPIRNTLGSEIISPNQ